MSTPPDEWDRAVALCAAQGRMVQECIEAGLEFENWANNDNATDLRVSTTVLSAMVDFDPSAPIESIWQGLRSIEEAVGSLDHEGIAPEVTEFYQLGGAER